MSIASSNFGYAMRFSVFAEPFRETDIGRTDFTYLPHGAIVISFGSLARSLARSSDQVDSSIFDRSDFVFLEQSRKGLRLAA